MTDFTPISLDSLRAPLEKPLTARPTGVEPINPENSLGFTPISLSSLRAETFTPIDLKELRAKEPSYSPSSAIISGAISNVADIGSSFKMLGTLFGSKELEEKGQEIYDTGTVAGKPYAPRVMGVEQVKSTTDLLEYVANQALTNVPQMAASWGGVAAGGLAGGAVAGPAGAAVGAVAAPFSISYLLNAGNTYQEMIDAGVEPSKATAAAAAAVGIPIAALDAFTSLFEIKLIAGAPIVAVKKGMARAAAGFLKGVGKTAAIEGTTEAAQEVMQAAVAKGMEGQPFLTPETAARVLNSFVGGAVVGGGFHAVGTGVNRLIKPLHALERESAPVEENAAPVPKTAVQTNETPTFDIAAIANPTEQATPRAVSQAIEPAPLGGEAALGPIQEEIKGKDYTKETTPSISKDIAQIVSDYSPEQMLDALSLPVSPLRSESVNLSSAVNELVDRKTIPVVEKRAITQALERGGMKADEAAAAYETYKPVFDVIKNRAANPNATVVAQFTGHDALPTEQMIRDVLPGKSVAVAPPSTGKIVTRDEKGQYRIEAENKTETANNLASPVLHETYLALSEPEKFALQDAWKSSGGKQTFGQYLAENYKQSPALVKIIDSSYKVIRPSLSQDAWILRAGEFTRIIPNGRVQEAAYHTAASAALDEEDQDLINKAVGEADKEFRENAAKFQNERDRWTWFYRTTDGLLRFAQHFNYVGPLQSYLDLNQEFGATKNRILYRANTRKMEIDRLGGRRREALAKYIIAKDKLSDRAGRKLTETEEARLAKKLALDPHTLAAAKAIEDDFNFVLKQAEEAQIGAATRRRGADAAGLAQETTQIKADFAMMRDRNYFPHTRFGDHIATVRAREAMVYDGKRYAKGDLVYMEAFDAKLFRDDAIKDLQKTFPAGRFNISKDTLVEGMSHFIGMPPSMLASLESELSLTAAQKAALREYMAKMAPGASARKHFLHRQGIAGYSQDVTRVYSDYMEHIGGLVARIKYYQPMAEAINNIGREASWIQENGPDATTRRAIYAHALDHYNGLMNPVNELANSKAILFHLTFWLRPKHWMQNFANVFASYNQIATKAGRGFVSPELSAKFSKSFHDVLNIAAMDKNLTTDERTLVQRGIEEGVLAQSFAQNTAEAGRGGLTRLIASHPLGNMIQTITRLGMKPMAWSEEYARRAAFLASLRMNEALPPEQRFKEARDVVQKTFNEFASWNRPNLLQGGVKFGGVSPTKWRLGLLTVMQSWQFNQLKHIWRDEGGRRTLITTALLAGLRGLPFAEDANDVLKSLLTTLREYMGVKDPYFDPAMEVTKLMKQFINFPVSYIMHGAGSRSFGLADAAGLFGMPFPLFDVSGSLGLGKVIPGLPIAISTLERRVPGSEIMNRMAKDAKDGGGALVAAGMSAREAMLEHDPVKVVKMVGAIRDILRAVEAANTGQYKDSRGNPVLPINPSDGQAAADLFALALGLTPSELSFGTPTQMGQEARWAATETATYYRQWREHAIQDLVDASIARDEASLKDAKNGIRQFNLQAPNLLHITADETRRSVRARSKNRRLRELGMPLERRYTQVYRDVQGAYQDADTD